MGVLRPVAISVMVILAGFLFLNGLGTTFGIISEIDEFSTSFPTDADTQCDWNEKGSFFNVNVTQDCQLQIQDLNVKTENEPIIRFLAENTGDWNSHYTRLRNIEQEDDEVGDYITPSQEVEPVEINRNVDIVDTEEGVPNDRFDTTVVDTTYNVGVAKDDMLLLTVGVANPSAEIQSAYYNDTQLERVARSSDGQESSTMVYRVVNPQDGTNNLNFTLTQKSKGNYGLIHLENVDQDNPISDVKSRSSASGGIDTAITSDTGNLVLDSVASREAVTPDSGQNLIYNLETENERDHATSWKQTGDATTMGWDTTDDISQVVLDVESTSSQQNISQYFTNRFYLSNETVLDIEYIYNETSAPEDSTLYLFKESTGSVVESFNLSESDSLENVEAVDIDESGVYSFHLEITEGTYQEQKLYRLYASQDSEFISNVSIGEYTSQIINGKEELTLNRVRYVGENILRHNIEPGQKPRTVQIELEGYRNGQKVDQFDFEVDNGANIRSENFFEDVNIDAYKFDVYLIAEGDESPRFESLVVDGTTFERTVSREVAENFRTVLFIIFLAMALAYLASSITKGRRR